MFPERSVVFRHPGQSEGVIRDPGATAVLGPGSPLRCGQDDGRGDQLFSSSTLRLRDRISLTRTLKLSGMPASKVSSPRTMDS
ncbi:MAG: hypothetical protein EBS42_02575 [Caulobacteraceae bacterium]|nr:hypothetical protein [Caulobacteraceae bacterium]